MPVASARPSASCKLKSCEVIQVDLETIALEVTQAYDSAKSAHKRLDRLEQEVSDIHELAAAMSSMSEKVDGLTEDMGEVKKEVKKVAERPVKWWDKLVAAAIGAIASGLVAAVLTMILK